MSANPRDKGVMIGRTRFVLSFHQIWNETSSSAELIGFRIEARYRRKSHAPLVRHLTAYKIPPAEFIGLPIRPRKLVTSRSLMVRVNILSIAPVMQKRRRTHIDRRLMREMLSWLRRQGCHYLEVIVAGDHRGIHQLLSQSSELISKQPEDDSGKVNYILDLKRYVISDSDNRQPPS